ncbi:MAG: ketopantoate reductase family protein [Chitinivibrionales bacterium]|nr:ketopantoate reductase family protein [Chitinivibrionales bacterium]
MNIAVIGIGGVGGYFGGKLTQVLKSDKNLKIYFIARGKHLDEIRKNGLRLDSQDGQMLCRPTLATDSIAELPILDISLVCVKSYDLNTVLHQLKPRMSDATIILPLLNGVDIYERIRAIISNAVILPACVYIGTHIEKPGTVTQRGGPGAIILGNDPQREINTAALTDVLTKADIKFNWSDAPYSEIWSKFVFIASLGLVTANFNKTVGEIIQSEELSVYAVGVMKEIIAIANSKKVSLPASLLEDVFTKAKSYPFETKTSFQRDFEIPGHKDERDLFGGAIIRMGKELNIKTETTKMIYDSLQKKKAPV